MKRYNYKDGWYTIKELSEMSGILPHTIRDRLRRGYSIEEAVKVTATNDSVREFCNASSWEDWIGYTIQDLYEIYWKWSIREGYSPLQKQGFSRQLNTIYPFLKTVPTSRGYSHYRIIRKRD